MLENWKDFPKYQAAINQLEIIKNRVQQLETENATRTQTLQEALQTLEAIEANIVLGRASEADVKPLRATIAKLDVVEPIELKRLKSAAQMLESEIPALKESAILQFCSERKPAYVQALRELAKALREADKAYQQTRKLFNDAEKLSPGRMSQLQTGGKNPDLPECLNLPEFELEFFEMPKASVWNDQPKKPVDRLVGVIGEYVK